jgi:antitoxin YefM
MGETGPISEAKAHLSDLADRVQRHQERILVTRNGRPSFVLVSPDELEALEDALAILSDPELAESIRRSRQEGPQLPKLTRSAK